MPRRQRGGSGGVVPVIIKLRGRWRSVANATPRPLYPLAKSPGTHCWFGLWTGVEKRTSSSYRGPNPESSSPQQDLYRLCYLDPLQVYAVGRFVICFILQGHTNCLCQIALLTNFFYTDPTFVVIGTSYESRLLFSSSCYPVMYEGSFRK